MTRDKLFDHPRKKVEPFDFNQEVVDVFDNMVVRSVPGYLTVQELIAHLCFKKLKADATIVDLGCSTGTTLGLLNQTQIQWKLIGVDSSLPMIEQAQKRYEHTAIEFIPEDIRSFNFPTCSAIILNLTLQFIPRQQRIEVLKKCSSALGAGGLLFLHEKMLPESSEHQDLFNELYESFKKDNGYSSLEIKQKKQALENVLMPEALSTHQQRLESLGFVNIELLTRWLPFTFLMAQKK